MAQLQGNDVFSDSPNAFVPGKQVSHAKLQRDYRGSDVFSDVAEPRRPGTALSTAKANDMRGQDIFLRWARAGEGGGVGGEGRGGGGDERQRRVQRRAGREQEERAGVQAAGRRQLNRLLSIETECGGAGFDT